MHCLTYRASILLELLLWWSVTVDAREFTSQEEDGSFEKLIRKLGSDLPNEREDAASKLKSLGESAVSALEKATKNADSEIAQRSSRVLRAIRLRKTLSPRLLRAMPGVEDALAGEDARAWTRVFLSAFEEDDFGNTRFLTLRPVDLEPLASPALASASEKKEQLLVCKYLGLGRFYSASPQMKRLLDAEDWEVRQAAIETIDRLGCKEMAALIAARLKDKNPWVRFAAARTLASLACIEAIPNLIDVTKDEDLTVLHGVVDSLAHLYATEAVPALTKLLRHQSERIRCDALEALDLLHSRETIPEIEALLEDKEPDVQAAAAVSLGHLRAKAAIEGLKSLAKNSNDQVRGAAIGALGRAGGDQVATLVLNGLRDGCPAVQFEAVKALRRLQASTYSEKLVTLATSSNQLLQTEAIHVLLDWKAKYPPSTIEPLNRLRDTLPIDVALLAVKLFDPKDGAVLIERALDNRQEGFIRAMGIRACVVLGQKQLHSRVIQCLDDQNPEVRESAIDAVGLLRLSQCTPQLLEGLEDNNPTLALAAARSLSVLGARGRVGEIRSLVSKSANIEAIAHALMHLGSEKDASLLAPLLSDERPQVRLAAFKAIVALDGQGHVAALQKLADEESRIDIRKEVLLGLGHLDGLVVEATLNKCINDPSPDIRMTAAQIRIFKGDRSAVPLLLSTARQHSDLTVLNRIRNPGAWDALSKLPWGKGKTGLRRSVLDAVAAIAKMELLVPSALSEAEEFWLDSVEDVYECDAPVTALEAMQRMVSQTGNPAFSWVLDPDQLRILPTAQALRFWNEWWKSVEAKSR
jgi:HEAT repeat protein